MAEHTEISWADATFNPWIGCTKVSAACDNCYAEAWAKRSGNPDLWQGERRRTKTWREPLKWNREAALWGGRKRVFCASLADVFDNQVPREWRADLWALISECTSLDWMLLTKRPQNIAKMLPPAWPWPHVWLGTTVESPAEYRRIGFLQNVSARVRFLSVEPILAPVDDIPLDGISWVICGGESGPNARPMQLSWVRNLRNQCQTAGVAFHFKQVGGRTPKSGGCLLDGVEHKEFPVAA